MQQELVITVTKVTIVTGSGPDKVAIDTCHLSPIFGANCLSFDFDTRPDDGYRYVTEHMGIDPKLIEIVVLSKHTSHFSV